MMVHSFKMVGLILHSRSKLLLLGESVLLSNRRLFEKRILLRFGEEVGEVT